MKHSAAALLCIFILAAVDATAQSKSEAWTTPSAEQLNAIYPEVEALYLDLHRTPYLAMHEQLTAAKLAERAKSLGYEVTTGRLTDADPINVIAFARNTTQVLNIVTGGGAVNGTTVVSPAVGVFFPAGLNAGPNGFK